MEEHDDSVDSSESDVAVNIEHDPEPNTSSSVLIQLLKKYFLKKYFSVEESPSE